MDVEEERYCSTRTLRAVIVQTAGAGQAVFDYTTNGNRSLHRR